MHSFRLGALGLILLLTAWAAPALAVGGLDGPNQPRGFVPGVPYTGGEYGGIDSVSPFSGALVLTMPIGQGFPVGGDGLGYGFTAFYNSNVWSFVEGTDGEEEFVVADFAQGFNAGLGWSVSLGRLLKPNTGENPTNAWIYVGPDGGSHKFFDELHPDDDNPAYGVKYARDGSYLRLKNAYPGSNTPAVQFPNGIVHVFDAEGWPIQFKDQRVDGSGNPLNWVNITHPLTYPSNKKWRIEDSQGRVHVVYFESNFKNGGKVDKVELQAFGSTPGNRQTATYDFVYETKQIRRTCHDTWSGNNQTPGDPDSEETKISTSLLRRVYGPTEAPASEQIEWLYWESGQPRYHLGDVRSSSECTFGGVLEGMTLPTKGEVSWDWQVWEFPSTGVPYVDSSPGVKFRNILNKSADWNSATWKYTPTVSGSQIETVVRDPESHKAKYYFNAPTNSSMPWDYGLPIDKNVPDPLGGGRYLSQEVINSAGTTLRKVYLKFTKD